MSEQPSQPKHILETVFESSYFWGFITLIAIAYGFSPRESGAATWVALGFAVITATAMVWFHERVRNHVKRIKFTFVGTVVSLILILPLGFWWTTPKTEKQVAHAEPPLSESSPSNTRKESPPKLPETNSDKMPENTKTIPYSPIEITVKCDGKTLPILIPGGEAVRLLYLIKNWKFPYPHARIISNLTGQTPAKWPPADLLTITDRPSDFTVVDCEIKNHANKNVINLTVPFRFRYGNTDFLADVVISPLDAGKAIHLYVVNSCKDDAWLMIPKIGKGQPVGEKSIREFEFESENGEESFGVGGVSFKGGWAQVDCE